LKILVIGGAGYIGSHMLRELLGEGFDPLVFDNLSTGHNWAVPKSRLLEGDLADKDRLREVFATHQFDAVMHS
jgi:UDP-glucose 4-epimerase